MKKLQFPFTNINKILMEHSKFVAKSNNCHHNDISYSIRSKYFFRFLILTEIIECIRKNRSIMCAYVYIYMYKIE